MKIKNIIGKRNGLKGIIHVCRSSMRCVDTHRFLVILSTMLLLQSSSLSTQALQRPTLQHSNYHFEYGLQRQNRVGRPFSLNLARKTNGLDISTTTVSQCRRLRPQVFTSIQKTGAYDANRAVTARQLSMDDGPTEAISLEAEVYDPIESDIYYRAVKKTVLCVGLTVAFGLGILYKFGGDSSAEFFAGYLVEQSLSIDNLFVFLTLFDYFKVPLKSQDRVLTYGIYGAVFMRAFMISLGSVALERYRAILLVFAGILVYSGGKVLVDLASGDDEEEEDMSENAIVKFSTSLFSATDKFDGRKFFTMEDGIRKATPLFLCLVAVEISDVVFAVDSIPAVFGVTENPLIVFTSNMFAILGLRSIYTILSKAAKDLEYLEPAVAIVLGFIGSKMVAEYFGTTISTELSLGVVLTCLSAGVGLSVWKKGEDAAVIVVDSPSDINQ